MRIALLGDIALLGRYDCTIDDTVEERLREVRDCVCDCDFVIANLEAPLTEKTKTTACKGVYLRSDPANAEMLQYVGVTHASIANNHIFDFGKNGMLDTVRELEKRGIVPVGLNLSPAILERDGDRAMLDGFCCYSANGLHYGKKSGTLRILSPQNLRDFLTISRESKCLPIVSAHFGREGIHYPSAEHLQFFRRFATEIPFVLHGNHPHAIQGYEKIGESALFYSLGNLCFDSVETSSIRRAHLEQTRENRENLVVKLMISDNRLTAFEILTMTDLPDGRMHLDRTMQTALDTYCKALQKSPVDYAAFRAGEVRRLQKTDAKRNAQFYLNRLNARYIGAYLNGKHHTKAYQRIFSEFITGK